MKMIAGALLILSASVLLSGRAIWGSMEQRAYFYIFATHGMVSTLMELFSILLFLGGIALLIWGLFTDKMFRTFLNDAGYLKDK
jgi:hypothetical protein